MIPEVINKRKTTIATFVFLLLLFLTVNFLMVAPYLLALVMGGLLALVSRPLYLWLRDRKLGSYVSAFIVTAAVLLLVVGPMIGFVIAAVDQAVVVANKLTQQDISYASVAEWATRWKPIQSIVGDATAVEKQLRGAIQKGGSYLPGTLLGVFGSLPELGLQVALTLLGCFFFVVDGRRFYTWVWNRIPLDVDVRATVFNAFKDTAISSLVATLVAASAQAAVVFIGFLVLGVPGAFLAGGATFIFAWIPILGSTPVWAAASIYLYLQGDGWKTVWMVVFGIAASLIDNVARPMVLKGRDEMHPLVSLVAIFGGIAMFGLLGVFIGPIMMALLISLLQVWPVLAVRYKMLDASLAPTSKGQELTELVIQKV